MRASKIALLTGAQHYAPPPAARHWIGRLRCKQNDTFTLTYDGVWTYLKINGVDCAAREGTWNVGVEDGRPYWMDPPA